METRFKMLTKSKPEDAKRLWTAGTAGRGNALPHVRVSGRNGKLDQEPVKAARRAFAERG